MCPRKHSYPLSSVLLTELLSLVVSSVRSTRVCLRTTVLLFMVCPLCLRHGGPRRKRRTAGRGGTEGAPQRDGPWNSGGDGQTKTYLHTWKTTHKGQTSAGGGAVREPRGATVKQRAAIRIHLKLTGFNARAADSTHVWKKAPSGWAGGYWLAANTGSMWRRLHPAAAGRESTGTFLQQLVHFKTGSDIRDVRKNVVASLEKV